jgi:two-component system, LytTR family, response regulator
MLKAIIIDDEEGARFTLSTLLEEYCPSVSIIAQCSNVPEGVLAINKHTPDIVFLDIEMPEYNGFELLEFFKIVDFEIIFVTAYSQYAIRAFEVSAVDYLLKPVEIEQLQAAVEKASQKRTQANIMQRLDLMKSTYNGDEIKKIALPMSDGLMFVDVAEIILFEADRAYTHVFLKNGSKITVSKPMRTFEDILENRNFIYRPHRSHLININYIKKYVRGDGMIFMDNGVALPVSRERKQEFEALLKELRILN